MTSGNTTTLRLQDDQVDEQTSDLIVVSPMEMNNYATVSDKRKKSKIQLKLESRRNATNPQTSTEQSLLLKDKLKAANTRRDQFLNSIATKIQSKMIKVANLKNETNTVQALEQKLQKKQAAASENRSKVMNNIAKKIQSKMERPSTAKNNEEEVQALKEKLQKKQAAASENRNKVMNTITTKIQSKMERPSTAKYNEEEVQALKEKLQMKQATAIENRNKVMINIAKKIQSKIERVSSFKYNEEELKTLKEKLEKKQAAASENKTNFMNTIATKIQSKMEMVANYKKTFEEQNDSDVLALEKKLQRKQAAISENRDKVMNSISTKIQSKMERPSTAKYNEEEVKALEEKLQKKQVAASENRNKVMSSIAIKIESKMERVTNFKNNVNEKNVSDVRALEEKLQKKQAAVSENRVKVMSSIATKNQSKMERVTSVKYNEEELKVLKEKLQKKQAAVSENKNNFMNSIATKIQSKMERVANYKKAIEEQNVSEVRVLEKKLQKKQAIVSENKYNLMNDMSSRIQLKLDKVTNFKNSFNEQNISHVASLEKKLQKKQATATINKETLMSNVSTKLQSKTEKVSNIKTYIKEQETTKVKVLEEKIVERQARASSNKENLIEKNSERFLVKKNRIMNANESALSTVSDLDQRLTEKMNSAVQRKDDILTDIVGLNNKNKLAKLQEFQNRNDQKVKDLSVRNKTKLLVASQKRNKALSDVSKKVGYKTDTRHERALLYRDAKIFNLSSVQNKLEHKMSAARERQEGIVAAKSSKATEKLVMSSKKAQEILIKREAREKKLKMKYEDKLKSAERRRELMRELEDQKKEIMRMKREKIRSLKLLKNQKKITEKIERQGKSMTTPNYSFDTIKEGVVEEEEEDEDELNSDEKLSETFEEDSVIDLQEGNDQPQDNLYAICDEEDGELISEETFEERRLAAQAQAREEIRVAKEVKREEMANITKEIEERREAARVQALEEIQLAKEAKVNAMATFSTENNEKSLLDDNKDGSHSSLYYQSEPEDEDEDEPQVTVGGLTELKNPEERVFTPSTASTTSVYSISASSDWGADEEISYTDSMFESTDNLEEVKLEHESESKDVITLQQATTDLARIIRQCDVKLSDIQLMQSLILAEEASRSGKDEFKTLANLDELDRVEMTLRLRQDKPSRFSRFKRVKQEAGERVRAFKRTAARIDMARRSAVR